MVDIGEVVEMTRCNDVLEECQKHFNEIGLFGDMDMCRLIGYAEDEYDCYYKTMHPSILGDEPKIVYESAVGAWETMKGIYPRYEALEHQFSKVWNCPEQKEFANDWIGETKAKTELV